MQANPAGAKGITALHLAAMRNDSSAAAHLISSYCREDEWLCTLTEDGLSPSRFAQLAGNHVLDAEIQAQARSLVASQRPHVTELSKGEDSPVSTCQGGVPARGIPSKGLQKHPSYGWLSTTPALCGSPANSTSSKDTDTYIDLFKSAVESRLRCKSSLRCCSDDESAGCGSDSEG